MVIVCFLVGELLGEVGIGLLNHLIVGKKLLVFDALLPVQGRDETLLLDFFVCCDLCSRFFVFYLGGVFLDSEVFLALVQPVNVLLEQSDLLVHKLHLDLVELNLLSELRHLGQGVLVLTHVQKVSLDLLQSSFEVGLLLELLFFECSG